MKNFKKFNFLVVIFYFLALFLSWSSSAFPQATTEHALLSQEAPEVESLFQQQGEKKSEIFLKEETARPLFEQSMQFRESPVELTRKALVAMHQKKFSEAKELLRQSIAQKLDDSEAWLLLGMIDLQEKKNEAAFADLIQATLYDPKNARAQHYLGIAAGRQHWSEIAEASLRKALELDPNYGEAHFNLAVYYLQHHPPAIEVARRHYQRALDLGVAHDPNVDRIMQKSIANSKENTSVSASPP